MKGKAATLKPSAGQRRQEVDPVQVGIRQVKTTAVALRCALTAASRAEHESGISVTVSRIKRVGTVIEFSTLCPSRRQTIALLLTNDQAFLESPASKRVANQMQALAEGARRQTVKRVVRS